MVQGIVSPQVGNGRTWQPFPVPPPQTGAGQPQVTRRAPVMDSGNLLGMVMAGQGCQELETDPDVVFLGQGHVADLGPWALGRRTGTAVRPGW